MECQANHIHPTPKTKTNLVSQSLSYSFALSREITRIQYMLSAIFTLALLCASISSAVGNRKTDLSGKWYLANGYFLENDWEEIVEHGQGPEFTIESLGKGFYEYSVDFKFESPVLRGGELVSEFTAAKRMVEAPTFKRDGALLGIDLDDPATVNYWVSDSGNEIEYVLREGGPEGTLVTRIVRRVKDSSQKYL